jgi:hypothetical protein
LAESLFLFQRLAAVGAALGVAFHLLPVRMGQQAQNVVGNLWQNLFVIHCSMFLSSQGFHFLFFR